MYYKLIITRVKFDFYSWKFLVKNILLQNKKVKIYAAIEKADILKNHENINSNK